MDNLKNKTILIGREPSNSRLQLSVEINGQYKSVFLGTPNSVSNSVSRCIPSQDKSHCKLVIDSQSRIRIVNANPQNITFVNNVLVESKIIDKNSLLMLGQDKYSVSVSDILEPIDKIVNVVTEVSIKHLEKIYDEYHEAIRRINKKAKNMANARTLYLPISGIATILSYACGGDKIVQFIGLGLGVVLMSFFAILGFTDKSVEEKEKLAQQFQEDYVCPKCGIHINGAYNVIKKYKNCPHCKVKWTTE